MHTIYKTGIKYINNFCAKSFLGRFIIFSYFLICFTGLNNAIADTQCANQIHGVNMAGAEFGNTIPGVSGRDYTFPTLATLQYYSGAGFNATRLPILWERIQPELFGDLDSTYSQLLLTYMRQAASMGQRVVVDVHNYDRYHGQVVGTQAVPNEAFRDLWSKLAILLQGQPALYAYGLMNEPHSTQGLWHTTAQFGVDGIRKIDNSHFIYVAGDEWSGAASWSKANPLPFVNDPQNKIIYEAHVYFDEDFSGRYQKPLGNTDLNNMVKARLNPFINWLVKYHQNGVIGEWGIPTSDLTYKDAVNSFIASTNSACLDWFIWSGGQFRPSYILSLTPDNGVDKPMLTYLKSSVPLVSLKPQ